MTSAEGLKGLKLDLRLSPVVVLGAYSTVEIVYKHESGSAYRQIKPKKVPPGCEEEAKLLGKTPHELDHKGIEYRIDDLSSHPKAIALLGQNK